MYWHELIHELEIIPAFECFLIGVIVGMLVAALVFRETEERK